MFYLFHEVSAFDFSMSRVSCFIFFCLLEGEITMQDKGFFYLVQKISIFPYPFPMSIREFLGKEYESYENS